MRISSVPWAIIAAALAFCSIARGSAYDVARQAETSVALVHLTSTSGQRDTGSAFCVSRAGLFIATEHGCGAETGQTIQLILSPNAPGQQVLEAKVVRTDHARHVALMQVTPPAGLVALELSDAAVHVGTEVVTFDHSLRGSYRARPPMPSPAFRITKITGMANLPRIGRRLGCDALLTYGESGAPVLNDVGRVVGMVDTVVLGSNHGASIIPAESIREFVSEPAIIVEPTQLPYEKRFTPMAIKVSVLSTIDPPPRYEVAFSMGPLNGPLRTVTAPLTSGTCTLTLAPCSLLAGRKRLLKADFAAGSLQGEVTDREIRIGERDVHLDEIRQIDLAQNGGESVVTFITGAQRKGKVTGLNSVQVKLGGATAATDLSRATSITLEDPDADIDSVTYLAVVKSGNSVVASARGSIGLTRAVAEATPSNPAHRSGSGRATPSGRNRSRTIDLQSFHTALAGGMGGNPMQIITRPLQDVIGFRYSLATWDQKGIVRTLIPIYDRTTPAAPDVVLARKDYVVGALLVDSDRYAHAVRIVFMRLKDGKVDVADSYQTDWIGQPSSGLAPKQLAGDGQHVVGVCGRKGLNMDAIGLVVKP